MHFGQEYHRRDIVLHASYLGVHDVVMMLLLVKLTLNHLVRWCLLRLSTAEHYFLFVINTCFVGRYLEIMQTSCFSSYFHLLTSVSIDGFASTIITMMFAQGQYSVSLIPSTLINWKSAIRKS